MYVLNIEKTQVESAKSLPSRWNKIFKKSKEVHFRVTPLKEKYTEITKMQILKFLKEVRIKCIITGVSISLNFSCVFFCTLLSVRHLAYELSIVAN